MFLLRSDCVPSELQAVVTHRELAAGQLLYRRGDPAVSIFAVERGRLQLFSYTSEGRPVPLYGIRAGECVSEAALHADNYCGDVVAEVASRVAVFPKGPLLSVFRDYPALGDEFMRLLTRRFNLLRVRLELRSLQSARERVLQYLLFHANASQGSMALDRPLKSIADDLGLTHECFYRTLAQLAKEGAITRAKGLVHFNIPSE